MDRQERIEEKNHIKTVGTERNENIDYPYFKKTSVAYSFHRSYTDQLDFRYWQADGSMTK